MSARWPAPLGSLQGLCDMDLARVLGDTERDLLSD
jgi:hypothetical protein